MNKCMNLIVSQMSYSLSRASERGTEISPSSAEVFQLVRGGNVHTHLSVHRVMIIHIRTRTKSQPQTHVEGSMSQGEGTGKNGGAVIGLYYDINQRNAEMQTSEDVVGMDAGTNCILHLPQTNSCCSG